MFSYEQFNESESEISKLRKQLGIKDTAFSSDEEENVEVKNDNKRKSSDINPKKRCKKHISESSNSYSSESEPESLHNDNKNETELIDDTNFQNICDPFVKHLENDGVIVSSSFNKIEEKWEKLGKFIVKIPVCTVPNTESRKLLEKNTVYAKDGQPPTLYNSDNIISNSCIKPQIIKNFKNIRNIFTPHQIELFSIINNYQDLYYHKRTFENAYNVRFSYCLHVANHILKTRTKIIHHNAKLRDNKSEEYRDQGLVRPKVLILVPFMRSAYKIVSLLTKLILDNDKGNVSNHKRFEKEYTGNELYFPKMKKKPKDFELTLEGNINDDFKIGIAVTKKSIKLYSDFYSSDIIIASPLGLTRAMLGDGESKEDHDFLSSIEIIILDEAEIFLYQNFQDVFDIFTKLHEVPKKSHDTDFSRSRLWSLEGLSKFYRQTLIFSSIHLQELASIINGKCFNYEGSIQLCDIIKMGSICDVTNKMPHRFYKFPSSQDRKEVFVKHVLEHYKHYEMRKTVIFIPNYYEFTQLRNYFKENDLSFTQIHEYMQPGRVARARDIFYNEDVHFLLYTERYHFFNRIELKGIYHLIFFAPPHFPHFYSEMCNMMVTENNKKFEGGTIDVYTLYNEIDIHSLCSIVGTEKAYKMKKSESNVNVIVM